MEGTRYVLGAAALLMALGGLRDEAPGLDRAKTDGHGGLVTLYADDPVTSAFSFVNGRYGGVFEDHVRKNAGAELDFENYVPGKFTVAIDSVRRGSIVDLGSIQSLQAKYGYEETVGGGQGFASIRRDGGRFVILKKYETQTTQTLVEARPLSRAPDHAPVIDDHIYLARISDVDQPALERIVKILVVTYQPGESVTLRWEFID